MMSIGSEYIELTLSLCIEYGGVGGGGLFWGILVEWKSSMWAGVELSAISVLL